MFRGCPPKPSAFLVLQPIFFLPQVHQKQPGHGPRDAQCVETPQSAPRGVPIRDASGARQKCRRFGSSTTRAPRRTRLRWPRPLSNEHEVTQLRSARVHDDQVFEFVSYLAVVRESTQTLTPLAL